ncbi:MAG: hypothetical protein K2M39_00865 [Muribaculaceae bacterium]|nr:hypothetical protein [Muribaculaceae bacterium]
MMNNDNFEAIKAEILKRAKEHHACTEQYSRAYKSENLAELMQVIKDNFNWACHNDVVTPDIIEQYREDFAANDIYLNVDANRGFLICDNATVTACDSAYCTSLYMIECKLYGNAIYRLRSENTIFYANDETKFVKQ